MTIQDWEKAVAYNAQRLQSGEISAEDVTRLTYYTQQHHHELKEDGLFGPLTKSTLEEIYRLRPALPKFDPWDGPEPRQPRNRKEIAEIFGQPGKWEENAKWTDENIMYCHKSRGTRLPGVPGHLWVPINRRIYPYLREALDRATKACPNYKIERLGGHNWRTIRHIPGGRLSTHAWGISVDINPHWNRGLTFDPGQTPDAWSLEYWNIWPNGVPEGYVRAFQSCGFAWGMDWDEDNDTTDHTYVDPMHFEWVERGGGTGREV